MPPGTRPPPRTGSGLTGDPDGWQLPPVPGLSATCPLGLERRARRGRPWATRTGISDWTKRSVHSVGCLVCVGEVGAPVRDWDTGRMTGPDRDRDAEGRARQARPRDALGRPLPYGTEGVEPVSEDPLPPEATLEAARALVDAGRPFAAHEVLEARWKAGPTEERDLWQGLAQVCVALTHSARGNRVGADRLFDRAAERLEAFATTGRWAYGLDMPLAVERARSHLSAL